jgi:hypothetical protein
MNATFLGFDAGEWTSAALSLIVPALAYTTLFMLRRRMRKLPIVQFEYRSPPWLLLCISASLLWMLGFAGAVAVTLRNGTAAKPDVEAFTRQYYLPVDRGARKILAELRGDRLSGAMLIVDEYDGYSRARVLVNNTRVFGTHVDCRLRFQCKPVERRSGSPSVAFVPNPLFLPEGGAQFPENALPLERGFLPLLHPGRNFVDVAVEASGYTNGRENCRLRARLVFEGKGGRRVIPVAIDDDMPGVSEAFGTLREYPSHRACARFHFDFDLGANHA